MFMSRFIRTDYHAGQIFIPHRPRKMRLSHEPSEKNNRLSRRESCGLITEKFIIRPTVFNICKLFATALFAVPCLLTYVFFVFMYKSHLLSVNCSDNKRHAIVLIIINAYPFRGLGGVTCMG